VPPPCRVKEALLESCAKASDAYTEAIQALSKSAGGGNPLTLDSLLQKELQARATFDQAIKAYEAHVSEHH
jgi:hypothetical protein